MNAKPSESKRSKVIQLDPRSKRLKTRFGPDTRFEVGPRTTIPFREVQDAELERLKRRLLTERLGEVLEPGLAGYVSAAANEAAALAWVTPYPLLVFPTLFAEKADAALRRAERQEQIRLLSRELLAG